MIRMRIFYFFRRKSEAPQKIFPRKILHAQNYSFCAAADELIGHSEIRRRRLLKRIAAWKHSFDAAALPCFAVAATDGKKAGLTGAKGFDLESSF